LTTTWRRVDVACASGPPGPALVPSVANTLVIRSGPGMNTACPSVSDPVRSTPSFACSSSSADAVAALK
jgi:hypothetical protein